jgi:DNA polymerase III alpha subunit (gram-positive type)
MKDQQEKIEDKGVEGGYVIYCTDTETTGLDPVTNEIVELSMSRLIPEGEGYRREQKTWFIRALHPETISDEALAVSGHKREDVLHLTQYGRDTYREPSEVVSEVTMWIMDDDVSSMDRIFSGQNPRFDLDFTTEFYRRYDTVEAFPFSCERGNRMIDLKQMVLLFDICTGRRRKAYNLSSIVKNLGVKKGKAHRAEDDVRMTEDSIMNLVGTIRPIVREKFMSCYGNDDV